MRRFALRLVRKPLVMAPTSCCISGPSCLPTRYVFATLAMMGFMLVYAYKVVLSVLITVMVAQNGGDNSTGHECAAQWANESVSRAHSHIHALSSSSSSYVFEWSDSARGLALGAYFYGYVITQIPAGRLSEIVGSKWLFGGTNLIAAIASLALPELARCGNGYFVAGRILQGLSAGMAFPVMNSMIARWTPKSERSMITTMIYTGSHLGTVITLPIAGALSANTDFINGWPSVFYLLGLLGILWFVAWAIFVHESPSEHPHIRASELNYIVADQGDEKTSKNPPIPVMQILSSVPVWALVITHFCQNWGFLTILTEQPTYFQKVLHMDVRQNGALSSLPYLCCAASAWLAGYINDRARKSAKMSINVLRKVSNSIGFFGPALCLMGIVFTKCDTTGTVILFALALGFNGAQFSGFMCTHVDMAPDFAGSLMGLTNTIANLSGFLAPLFVEKLTDGNQTLAAWGTVFWVSAAVYSLGAIVYIFFATAQLQSWGIVNKKDGDANGNTASTSSVPVPVANYGSQDETLTGKTHKQVSLSMSRKQLVLSENE